MPDFRRAQGRKHTIASVFAINTVASLSGFESGIGAAQFARALNQTELKMLGAWFNPKTEKYQRFPIDFFIVYYHDVMLIL